MCGLVSKVGTSYTDCIFCWDGWVSSSGGPAAAYGSTSLILQSPSRPDHGHLPPSCRRLFGLTENWKGASLFAYSLHPCLVVTPDVAFVERPLRAQIERAQWRAGADVITELLDQTAQRPAMSEAAPPMMMHTEPSSRAAPVCQRSNPLQGAERCSNQSGSPARSPCHF